MFGMLIVYVVGKEIGTMTDKQTFDAIRKLGMAVQKNDGEWQVDYRRDDNRKTPDSCYFTDDKDDALGTAKAMASFQR